MTRTEKALWILLSAGIVVDFWLAMAGLVCAQTAGQVETTVKASPVALGPLQCRGPVITSDKRQVLADADFKALQSAAKVDSSKVCSNYKVVPVSSAIGKPAPKGIIEKIVDFIFGG